MAITGMHALFHTGEADALRAVLRDAFGFSFVESQPGWPIFALPPAELAVHPFMGEGQTPSHELSFMCDDLDATVADLRAKGVVIDGDPVDRGFGIVVTAVLPGDIRVLVYEPRHPTAI